MAVSVRFDTRGDILIARASGELDPQADEQFDRQVAAECRRKACRGVLVDLRAVRGAPTSSESYRSGVSLEDRGFRRETRLAFLDSRDYQRANALYEVVARNRGFMLRHFYTEEEAFAWLELDA